MPTVKHSRGFRALDSRRRQRWATLMLSGAAALAIGLLGSEAEAAPSPSKRIGGSGSGGSGGNFGLGLSLGDPMGASAKLFLHPSHALQFDLGWQPLHHGGGGLTFNYLWHPATWASTSAMDFMGYLGVGVGASLWSDHYGWRHHHDHRDRGHGHTWFGLMLRAPVLGLAFHWKPVPLDTVIEGAWSPFLVEAAGGHGGRVGLAHGDVSVKVRYYF